MNDDHDLRSPDTEIDYGRPRSAWAYLALLALQSAAALALLVEIHRAFRIVVDDLGVLHTISPADLLTIAGAVFLSQTAYWYRFAKVQMPGWRNAAFGHLLGFASRLSFIFGAAMFSLFFLRHAPDLSSNETGAVVLSRGTIVLVALFCLYCFTLELERLGNSLQRPRSVQD
ncbi:hypothetical protein OIU35_28995 [Boseaceae bacterium BT-24-1]|nr:hypothetical protein [Boseaceae bacterium BT-24-1]